MYQPVPGGTSMMLEFDDESLEVFLPPVGYVVDKYPDLAETPAQFQERCGG